MTDSGADTTADTTADTSAKHPTNAISPSERTTMLPTGHEPTTPRVHAAAETPDATRANDATKSNEANDALDALHLEVTSLVPGRTHVAAPRRPWLRVAQAVSAIVVIVGVLYALVLPHPSFSFPPGPSLPTPVPFHYAGQALTCPTAAAWSPSSEQFAVVDYVACDREYPFNSADAVLAFYAVTGDAGLPSPRGVVVLDNLVIQRGLPASVRADAREMRSLRLTYTALGWSPDGNTLALTFAGGSITPGARGQPPTLQGDPRINGLILVARAGSHAARVYDQPEAQESTGARTDNPYPLVAWNTTTGQQEVLAVSESLAYRWSADDTLVATAPLAPPPAPAPALSPGGVGNPDGGASFTLWQVGYIHVGNPSCSSATGADLSYIDLGLETDGPVWSPDGAIFIPQGIYSGGRADAPIPGSARGPASDCVLTGSLAELPLVPVRDAALRAVLARLTPHSNVTLFWRPDGQRVLLMETPGTTPQGTSVAAILAVYDCATGQVVATPDISNVPNVSNTPNTPGSLGGAFGVQAVEWSPDGQRVLLVGYPDAPLVVLDASALGG